MAEPASTTIGGFFVFKIASGIAAVFGAMSMYSFWQPKRIAQLGRTVAFMVVCGMGGASGVMLTGGIALYLGLDRDSIDVGLSLGFLSGMFSLFIISLVANFARAREDKDLLEVVAEVRNVVKVAPKKQAVSTKVTNTKPVVKRPARPRKQASK